MSTTEGIVISLVEAGALHRLTPAMWTAWAEAAAVTFERFHGPPPPPCPCVVAHTDDRRWHAFVTWQPSDERSRATHANRIDATEQGAYAVAAAAMGILDGWRIVGRAQHASGADLVMLRSGARPDEFVHLEVSGMAEGRGDAGLGALQRRLSAKIQQLDAGGLERPGIAAVVGFELATVLISAVRTEAS